MSFTLYGSEYASIDCLKNVFVGGLHLDRKRRKYRRNHYDVCQLDNVIMVSIDYFLEHKEDIEKFAKLIKKKQGET